MAIAYSACTDPPESCPGFKLSDIFTNSTMVTDKNGAWDEAGKIDKIDQALMIIIIIIVGISVLLIISLLCGWKTVKRRGHDTFSSKNYYSGYLHSTAQGKNISRDYLSDRT